MVGSPVDRSACRPSRSRSRRSGRPRMRGVAVLGDRAMVVVRRIPARGPLAGAATSLLDHFWRMSGDHCQRRPKMYPRLAVWLPPLVATPCYSRGVEVGRRGRQREIKDEYATRPSGVGYSAGCRAVYERDAPLYQSSWPILMPKARTGSCRCDDESRNPTQGHGPDTGRRWL